MKQAILTIGVVAAAAGVLAGMVLYSVSFLRECERKLLTGDLSPITNSSWVQTE